MERLTGPQAVFFSVFVFSVTLLLSFFLPEYTITTGGLLLSIILTVFIPGKSSTVILTALSIILTISFAVTSNRVYSSGPFLTQNLFMVLLVVFTMLVVLYLKKLYINIRSDKTHMISLFENATEGIILTDSKGKIVLVNPAAEKMFEYAAEELIGKPIETLIPERHRQGHLKLRESFHQSPQNRVMGSGRDLYGAKKNGEDFPVEVSLSHYRRNNESFVIAFIVNITLRKEIENNMLRQKKELEKVTDDIRKLNTQLEVKVEERTLILKEALQKLEQSQQELNEALDKERELNEIKSRFVSLASHEFRTPLSTVLSSASLISKYTTTEDQEKRDRHINRIKESVKHLNDILEDFLSLGKLNEGGEGASFAEFDLKEMIRETADEMKSILKQDQTIIYHHEGNASAHTDKKLLKNILINLIGNAVKFSGEGMTVEIKSSMGNGIADVSVTDKGIGISEEDQEHLFTSFFRGKNALNIQGTGLGLHIVKRYLDLLGGTVHLQSEINRGTTITVSIPVHKR